MLLLWTVMLSARAGAQSGEPDSSMVPTVYCWSHISLFEGSNITCQLVPSGLNLDDEDEDDEIENITACCCKLDTVKKCVGEFGETVSSKDLNPISPITLTAQSKQGHRIKTELDLRKIIKPKSPQVYNLTLNQDQVLFYVQIPYQRDYLTVENQRFQIQLWSEKTNLTKNMSSATMSIGLNHLTSGTLYHAKVRAVPWVYFEGTWSDWSQAVTFTTPKSGMNKLEHLTLWRLRSPFLYFSCVFFFSFYRILTYMWPSIPHPKTTFVQISTYLPNNGLLLNYNPEEFSSLKVHSSMIPPTEPSCQVTEPMLPAAGTEGSPSCPTPSTDASLSSSSVQTEELELLSQSSSEGEPDVPTEGLPVQNTVQHVEAPETPPMQHNNIQHERDDSYVTMSSFYQIKTAETDNKTVGINRSAT
ncbi:hypothetical protein NQD34_017129 [Periophthalmus magnuspinnatus]|nr:hypothetical protein NQD34_017129 [Periophthalmus magnuspinnatus]